MNRRGLIGTATALLALRPGVAAAQARLVEVAASDRHLWNGVAVAPGGRVFVCLPRALGEPTPGVAELTPEGALRPFPGGAWNDRAPGRDPAAAFVNVNSVWLGADEALWAVDGGSPDPARPLPGGPKLVRLDLAANAVARAYPFGPDVMPGGSVLNDVRVRDGRAYLTEHGRGALLVLGVGSGQVRRVLDRHPALVQPPGRAVPSRSTAPRCATGTVSPTSATPTSWNSARMGVGSTSSPSPGRCRGSRRATSMIPCSTTTRSGAGSSSGSTPRP